MTTQEEAQYIQEFLPELASRPAGYGLDEYEYPADAERLVAIATRMKAEGLATEAGGFFYLRITPKGKQIAEYPGGYVGYLAEEQRQQRREESRAKLNVIGTVGSAVFAGLALLFSAYTYYSAASDTKALEKKVEAQQAQLDLLKKQLRQKVTEKLISVPLAKPEYILRPAASQPATPPHSLGPAQRP